MKNLVRTLSVIAIMLALSAASAAAQTLTFTFTGIGVPETRYTTAVAINNAGVLAGSYIDNFGDLHGMILRGSKLTTVDREDCLPSDNVVFHGINNKTPVMAVGSCLNFDDHSIGFVWSAGKFVDITIPGAFELAPMGINDLGEIVGWYFGSDGNRHGFLLSGTTLTTLDPPGGDVGTIATSINNKGQITLVSGIPNGFPRFEDAFLYQNGKFTNIDIPEKLAEEQNLGLNNSPTGINNHGDIVFENGFQGILLHAGKYYAFSQGGGEDTNPTGLNDKLMIVGGNTNPNETWEVTTTITP
jgi:hypothetical protein